MPAAKRGNAPWMSEALVMTTTRKANRFWLWRPLVGRHPERDQVVVQKDWRSILFIMLNPSTADDKVEDPTIRRCIGFALQTGHAEMGVVNLNPRRATDPTKLKPTEQQDRMYNLHVVASAMNWASTIVLAWGSLDNLRRPAWHMAHAEASLTTEAAWGSGKGPWCLGQCKNHQPRHPLFVRGDTPLQPYDAVRPGRPKMYWTPGTGVTTKRMGSIL